MFNKKTVREWDLKGKRILMRADYNVPLKDGGITDDYRLKQSLPTIRYILEQPGTSLVIISHLGRPEGPGDKSCSLAPVAKKLSELLGKEVRFAADCVGDSAKTAAAELPAGEVLLLENVRFHPEEEKNDEQFARDIIAAAGAELFVQDGFGVVHRAHASTDAIARQTIPAVSGLLLEKEVTTILAAIHNPARPMVAVVGGAKISDKIDVLNKFIEMADFVAVVGAMANDFLIADGIKVGKSLNDPEELDTAREVLQRARKLEKDKDFNFLVPVDAVVSKTLDGKSPTRIVDIASHFLADAQAYPKIPDQTASTIAEDELIGDIGPISAAMIAGAVKLSKTVVWSGTCGVTETKGIAGAHDPFAHGTHTVTEAMIGASNNHQNRPFSVVGGGDTVGYVENEGLVEDFGHVSTGGSASLELMSGKVLPGINVLWDK